MTMQARRDDDRGDALRIARRILIDQQTEGDALWRDLADIQAAAPVLYVPDADIWVVTGYAEARAIMGTRGVEVAFSERNDRMTPEWRDHPARTNMGAWFGHKDGAEHMRTRKPLNGFFLPAAARSLGSFLDANIAEIVESYRARGGGNFLDLVGFEMTTRITDHLLGLDENSRPDFRRLIERIMKTFDFGLSDEQWRAADQAAEEMRGFWRARIAERMADPVGDDMMAQIIRTGQFGLEELVVIGENIIAAASDTTAHTSTNGMDLLLRQHPEILSALRDDAALGAPVAEEILRLVSAAPVSGRGLAEDAEIGGILIPKGAAVLIILGAANRDPRQFADPHRMILDRDNASRAIGFGHGLHVCLGQWVVREAFSRLYPEIARQCPSIAIDGPPTEARGLGIRHVPSLMLTLGLQAPPSEPHRRL